MTKKIDYLVTLTPAYGRDYKSAKAAIAAFEDGKDFIMHYMMQETPCSKSDFKPGTQVKIRYAALRRIAVHRVKP